MSYCLLCSGVSSEDYLRDTNHKRHTHISAQEKNAYFELGMVEWLGEGRALSRALRFVKKFRKVPLRGSSARFGWFLAGAIRRGEGWALVVRDEMRGIKEKRNGKISKPCLGDRKEATGSL